VDSDGYFVDPGAWTEDWARETAQAMAIALTPDHWAVIRFMRAYYDEHQVPADARFVMRHLSEALGAERNRLFELFPCGYSGQACKVAGMRRPRTSSHQPECRTTRMLLCRLPEGSTWHFRRTIGRSSCARRCSERWARPFHAP
jgi:tRNA 2-thiouridine synthesizing protein E